MGTEPVKEVSQLFVKSGIVNMTDVTRVLLMKMQHIGCIHTEKGIKHFCPPTHEMLAHSELGARTTVYNLLFQLCKRMENTCQLPCAEKRKPPARILYDDHFQFGGGPGQWQQKIRCGAWTL